MEEVEGNFVQVEVVYSTVYDLFYTFAVTSDGFLHQVIVMPESESDKSWNNYEATKYSITGENCADFLRATQYLVIVACTKTGAVNIF